MSTVLYPGSFDPFHVGHLDVVAQAVELFGDVVVAIMHNPDKPTGAFTMDVRAAIAEKSCAGLKGVSVRAFPGLAIDAARAVGADFIVKGLRTPSDFEIEQQMAHTNFAAGGVRTVYVPCAPGTAHVSSRYIRDIAAHGGDVSSMVVSSVLADIIDVLNRSRQ